MKMARARSFAAVACDCRPEDRLSLGEAAKALGVSPREADLLVDEKLLWVARVEEAGQALFCPIAIQSIAGEPRLLASLKRALAKSSRGTP